MQEQLIAQPGLTSGKLPSLSTSTLRYALITPAQNEEQGIEKTILSVIAQRLRPQRWVIVDDGSIDATSAIVSRYVREQNWMRLGSAPRR